MAAATPFWNRSTFLVLTGASRGIGKNLAIKFSSLVGSNSTFVLMARSLQNLEDTKNQILALNPTLDVKIHSVDLSQPNPLEFDALLTSSAAEKQFELYFLVHNAGTVLTNVPASKMDDVQQFNEYMTVNLYSATALTASFLKLFTRGERCIVNLSSFAAVHPVKGMAHYCVGKASRGMYFRVLAEENPDINILNYSPGPIVTDMYQQIAEDCWHEGRRNFCQNMIKNKTYVKIEDSVQKLVNVLKNRSYSSGDHVDIWTEIDRLKALASAGLSES